MGIYQLLVAVVGVSLLIRSTDAVAIASWTTPVVGTADGTGTVTVLETAQTTAAIQTNEATSTFVATDSTSTWTINAASGVLTTTATLDHETTPSYVVTIVATEPGTSTSGTLTLIIAVTDADDIAPQTACISNSYAVVLPSGWPSAFAVCTPAVTDDGGTVVYAIASGNTGSKFTIGANTGAITVSTNELITSGYTLSVTATQGTNVITGQVAVSIGTYTKCYCASGVSAIAASLIVMVAGMLFALQ